MQQDLEMLMPQFFEVLQLRMMTKMSVAEERIGVDNY